VSPVLALLLSDLFWPDFVEIKGMVFLASTFEDESDMHLLTVAEAKYRGNKEKIEESFNLIEVPSIFGCRMSDLEDDEYILFANMLASMWEARLKQEFNDKVFTVRILSSEETGGEIAILFKQSFC
jgi:hypothetical protein